MNIRITIKNSVACATRWTLRSRE